VAQTVVILLQVVLTEHHLHRIGIAQLAERFDVRIFDFTPWFRPDMWKRFGHTNYPHPGYVAIHDREQALREIATMKNAVAFDYLAAGARQNDVRTALKQHGVPLARFLFGLLPEPTVPSLAQRVQRIGWAEIPRKLWQKLWPVRHAAVRPDIVISTGEAGISAALKDVPCQIAAHGPEYDEFLLLDRERSAGPPYAVYIDEGIVDHPDYEYVGVATPTSAQAYFPRLNAFFDAFEAHAGMKIHIAAHPRSPVDNPHLFGGREQLRGQTARLVRDSSVVFAHFSTALAFAALWQKPVVFISNNEIDRSWMAGHVARRVELFGAPLVNVDTVRPSDIDLTRWLTINHAACEDYVRRYVRMPGSPQQPLWTIVSDYLTSRLQPASRPAENPSSGVRRSE
jgi:hypothetical protein